MGAIYQVKHQVVYYEADTTGYLSLPMIFNLAILASTNQAVELGIGPDQNHAQGLGWVVLQYDTTIHRRPKLGETVTIETEPLLYNPFFATRRYTFLEEDGTVLIDIRALFTMIDMEKRRMARIPHEQMEAYQAQRVKQIERMPTPQAIEEVDEQATYRVRYLDIDSNQHVNNSRYFDWLQDVLPRGFVQAHDMTRINIKFENEVRYGQTVVSQVTRVDGRTLHRIMNNDTIAAEAEVWWQ
jgi:medium-chain acyl-[acyl-carrier-protein] hydrolase